MAASFRTDIATWNTTSGTKTATITTVAGDYLVALVGHDGNVAEHNVTDDQGGTWERVVRIVGGTTADSMSLWVRTTLVTTGASTVVTTTPGTSTGGGLNVMAWSGMLRAGRAGIRQFAVQETLAAATPAPVFGRAPLTENSVILWLTNGTNVPTMTQKTNFTERQDLGHNVPAAGFYSQTRDSGETATTQTFNTASASAFSSMAVELDSSPADMFNYPHPARAHGPRRKGVMGPPVLVQQADFEPLPTYATVQAATVQATTSFGTGFRYITSLGFNVNDVAYGNGYYVIVGDGGGIAYTQDPVAGWTTHPSSGFSTSNIQSVYYGNGVWVAVGGGGKIGTATTPDGTWTQNTATGGALQDVEYADGIWVAVGNLGIIYTATTPTSPWTASPSSGVVTALNLRGLVYEPVSDKWIAVGAIDTTIVASNPAGTWTLVDAGAGSPGLFGIAADGAGRVIQIGETGGVGTTRTSDDGGTTWTDRSTMGGVGFGGIAGGSAVGYHNGYWTIGQTLSNDIYYFTGPGHPNTYVTNYPGSLIQEQVRYVGNYWFALEDTSNGYVIWSDWNAPLVQTTVPVSATATPATVAAAAVFPAVGSASTEITPVGVLVFEDCDDTADVTVTTGNSVFDIINGTGTMFFRDTPTPVNGTTCISNEGAANVKVGKDSSSLPGTENGGNPLTRVFARFYFRFSGIPTTTSRFFWFEQSVADGGADIVAMRVNTSGLIQLLDGTTYSGTQSTHALSSSEWTRIEVTVNQITDLFRIRMWWGADVFSESLAATNYEQLSDTVTSNSQIQTWAMGNASASGRHFYYDQIAVGGGDWIGPGSTTADALATPATVAGVATVGAPSIPVVVSVATVAGTATVGAPSIPVVVPVATVAGVATVPAPSIPVVVSVATVAGTTTIPQGAAEQYPATVLGTATIPTPSIPVVIPVVTVAGTATVGTARVAPAPAATVAGVATVGTPTIVAASIFSVATVAGTATVGTPSIPVVITVGTVSGTTTVPQGAAEQAPATVQAVATIPTPSIPVVIPVATVSGVATVGTARVTPAPGGTVAGTGTVGAPVVQASVNIVVATVAGTGTVGSPTVQVVIGAATVAGTATVGAPSIPVVVSVATVAGTATVGSPSIPVVISVATVAGTTTIPQGAAEQAPATVQAVATVPSPSIPVVIPVATVAGTATVGTARVAPAPGGTVAGTGTVGTPVVVASSIVTVATVAGTATVGSPSIPVVVSVATVNGTATIGPHAVAVIVGVATVAGTTTIGSPFIQPAPAATVAGTGTVGAPVVVASSIVTTTTVAGTGTVGTPGIGVIVRGLNRPQLVLNGDVSLGSNSNFSAATYDGAELFNGHGTLSIPAGATSLTPDARIDVDVTRTYLLRGSTKTDVATGERYLGLVPIDRDNLEIRPYYSMYQTGTLTTLAADLNPSDTVVHLTSSANWHNGPSSAQRGLIFWNYVDGAGVAWPANTYSRNGIVPSAYAQGGITGNDIALSAPYGGTAVPAGTQVSNGASAGTFKYTASSPVTPTLAFTELNGMFSGGPDTTGAWAVGVLPYGTTQVKPVWLDLTNPTGKMWMGEVLLYEYAAVTAVTTIPAPSIPVVIPVATVAATATVGTARVAPAPGGTVPGTATVGAPIVKASSVVSVATVAGTATVGAPSVPVVVSVATVAGTATVGSPSIPVVIPVVTVSGTATVGTARVAPAPGGTVQGTGTVGAPTISASSIVSVATVSGTATVGSPSIPVVVSVATVNGTATVGSPSVPVVIPVATVAGTATVGTARVAPAPGGTVNGTGTVGAPSILTSSIVTVATVAGTATVGSPSIPVVIPVTTVNGTATVGTASIPVVISVATVAGTATIGAPSVSAAGNVNVAAATVSATATVGAPFIQPAQPATVLATATVGAPFVQPALAGTVNGTATVGSPAVQASVTISTATVAGTATVGTPSIPVVIPVATVAGTATVGAPVVKASVTISVTTVAGTGTVGAPTLATSSIVSVSVVAGTATVGAPVFTSNATAAATTVAGTATVGSPSIPVVIPVTTVNGTTTIGTARVAPAPSGTVTGTATVGAPTILTTSIVTVATVNGTGTVGAPTISASSIVTVSTVAGTTSVGAPVISDIPAPPTVTAIATVGAPVVQAASSATTTPTTVAGTGTVGAPVFRSNATAAAATVNGTGTVGSPVVAAENIPAPVTVHATATVGAPVVKASSVVTTATVNGTGTVGVPTVSTVTAASPATVNAAATVGAPVVAAGAVATPATVHGAATVGTPVVAVGTVPQPSTVAATLTIATPTFTSTITAVPATVNGTASVGAPVIVAVFTSTAFPDTVFAVALIPAVHLVRRRGRGSPHRTGVLAGGGLIAAAGGSLTTSGVEHAGTTAEVSGLPLRSTLRTTGTHASEVDS